MSATLLLAAHGTRSAVGSATTAALAAAVAHARPDTEVSLCFLDVAEPSLAAALNAMPGRPVTVVPVLLSAGYHVDADIPAVVAGRPGVTVARHLGPDPAVIAAVADRLSEAGAAADRILLAAIASGRSSARAEVDAAAAALAERLQQPVTVAPLGAEVEAVLDATTGRLGIATYLIAEGGFLDTLRQRVGARGVVAEPIGVHPALVSLIWHRYDEAEAAREVR